ncbi:MAG: 6-carboxytetrahydropterin synthase QueD [Candidatus Cloacimonetes bacterium]|nr:6-carboxytetrahydropterin synthase QueD [Candidatus Cloacimonadota bacterium]
MYKLNVTETFSAAHRLDGYQGLCCNLHGHNWKVRVGLVCSELDGIGMALDFGIIKQHLRRILTPLDHAYLNDLPEFKGINPTSEHLAQYIHDEMQLRLADTVCSVFEVEISESEKTSVVYQK